MNGQAIGNSQDRSGLVLVAVLFVVSIMSLSAYSFARWMRVEREAAVMQLRTVQARLAAESAVELTRALLMGGRRGFPVPDLRDNPGLFSNIALFEDEEDVHPRLRARFSVMAPSGSGTGLSQGSGVRFGLDDENAKLDLNTWAVRNPVGLEQVLRTNLHLPTSVARDLTDWIDPGTPVVGRFETIAMTASPLDRYRPKNGPLATFDELLLVRGMNRRLLFGEREGQSEAAGLLPGPTSIPLSQITTIYSRASETDHSGRERIRLNDPDPVSVFRALRTEFGEPFARFVIALRLFGTSSVVSETTSGSDERTLLSRSRISSLLDLFEPQVSGTWQGRSLTVGNPLMRDPEVLDEDAARLFDRLTLSELPIRRGAINVKTASSAALAMLPGISEEERSQLLARQDDSDPSSGLAWLLTEGVVSATSFRALEPYVTERSDVFRVQAIGSVGDRGPMVQLEAFVDGTQDPPALLDYRILRPPRRRFLEALAVADEPRTLPDVTGPLPNESLPSPGLRNAP